MRTCVKERLGHDDRCGAAVGRGTALKFREWRVDFGRGQDLRKGVNVVELGVGVFGRMSVVDASDFSKVGRLSAVPENRVS